MKKLILLAGLPGSGKSTYCLNNFDMNQIVVFESDAVRLLLTESYKIMIPNMNYVYDWMIKATNAIFAQHGDRTVVLDSTFLTDERRNYFLDQIKGADIVELHMLLYHDIQTVLWRNLSRIEEKHVPEETILKMAKTYTEPSQDNIKRYTKIETFYID